MLTITISGGPAEGKTTLASEIAALLESLKMNVVVKDYDLENGIRSDQTHQLYIGAMAGCEVLITTEQPKTSTRIPHFWNKG